MTGHCVPLQRMSLWVTGLPGITHYPGGPLPMPLSDFACKNAKPKDKPYRLSDGNGLYLLVQKSGSKLWQLRYRYLEKENILSFGKYPLVSLLDAREKRDEAKRLLIAGINPSTMRKEEKILAITEARTTFGLIAEEYIGRMEERKAAATNRKRDLGIHIDFDAGMSLGKQLALGHGLGRGRGIGL